MNDHTPASKSLCVLPPIVPMPLPHRTASGTVAESSLVPIGITDAGNTTGHGPILTCASTVH